MNVRDDQSAIIRARLFDELERVLDHYCPNWIELRGRGFLAPKGKGDLGSWYVELDGARRGMWVRHSQGIGGDPLSLIAYCEGGCNAAALRVDARTFDAARRLLGLSDGAPDPEEARRRRLEAEARRVDHARRAAELRLRESARARDIWRAAGDAAGTPVAAWLDSRGLARVVAAGIPATLRYHPDLPFWWSPPRASGTRAAASDRSARPRPRIIHSGPAMVALATDGHSGAFRAVHLTWLAEGGRSKAAITAPDGATLPARKIRGDAKGAHVRLAPAAARLVVGEGIETCLAVQSVTGLPTWAALSLGNLGAALPDGTSEVVLACDADEADAAAAEATKQAAAAAHAARGIGVRLARPPAGRDFNSWLIEIEASERP